jgi:CHAD domain-containing protein
LRTESLAALRRNASARLDRLEALLAHADDPEGLSGPEIHQLHRELRALRMDLGLLSHLRSGEEGARARLERERISRLARRVGEVRDRTVAGELLDRPEVSARIPGVTMELARHLLRREEEVGRVLLQNLLASAELRAGLRWERRAWERLRVDPPTFRRAVARERRLRSRRVRRALKRARRRPSSRRLHRLRQALREKGLLSGALTETAPAGRAVRRGSDAWTQRELGRLHDLEMLRRWVARLPSPSEEDLEGAFRGEERRHLARILAVLSGEEDR